MNYTKKYFQAVYAPCKKDFEVAAKKIFGQKRKYPSLVRKFEGLSKRVTEWALYERMELLTRDNHTNNYSEANNYYFLFQTFNLCINFIHYRHPSELLKRL
jgi:hypothetical protein